MKPGLKIGDSAEIEIKVTRDMRAAFGGITVHELFSTSSLVHHMEWAARKVLEQYLESDEEAMGYHVEVTHLMLTLIDMSVRVKATVTEIREKRIVCEVEAFNLRGKIARGLVTQSLVEKEWLDKKMKEMSVVNQIASHSSSQALKTS